jgi:uncharacterized protein (DUF952 family)
MSDLIYHVTSQRAWDEAVTKGFYAAASLADEGFIHCSTAEQVTGVLERYYQGVTSLVKLVIDPDLLKSELKYELAPSVNELFPHVFGNINLDAVIAIQSIN